MSQIVFSPNALGSGQFTITAPNSNNNRTLTLPDATGTVLLDNNIISLNGGQLAGMRNKIINGNMNIAQRGTSFAAIAQGAYSLDRWIYNYATTAVATVTQNSDVPSNNEFQNSYRLTVTPTADTSIAAGDYGLISQFIEGFNVRDLISKTFTLSFWVRSAKTGVHCASFRNSAGDRSYVAEYIVNVANTWEQKSITVSGGLITAGTWNWTNGIGLQVGWALAAGTTFHTTAGAWQTGNFLATSSQVNVLDAVNNIFAITGVQLEVGGVATPFEHRLFGQELMLCQRYCQRFDVFPNASFDAFQTYFGGSNALSPGRRFSVPMRATPSATFTNAGVEYYSYAGAWTATTLTAIAQSNEIYHIYCASDGDGRGKLLRNGGAGVNPNPIVTFTIEL